MDIYLFASAGSGRDVYGIYETGSQYHGIVFATIAVAATLNIGPLTIVLPIIWCYSFFNVHNMYSLSDEEFYALEDDYIFYLDRILPINQWSKQQNKIVAGILIIAGICIFWNECVDYLIGSWIYVWFSESIANSISQFLHTLPRLVIAVILICVGIRMIKGKKVQLDLEEEKKEEL